MEPLSRARQFTANGNTIALTISNQTPISPNDIEFLFFSLTCMNNFERKKKCYIHSAVDSQYIFGRIQWKMTYACDDDDKAEKVV